MKKQWGRSLSAPFAVTGTFLHFVFVVFKHTCWQYAPRCLSFTGGNTETWRSNNCVFSHQELVNLLLCGRAVSNVFDDDVELDSGNGNMTLLKGIKGHCDVGLLSLFEHYNICKVRNTEPLTDHIPVWFMLHRQALTSGPLFTLMMGASPQVYS